MPPFAVRHRPLRMCEIAAACPLVQVATALRAIADLRFVVRPCVCAEWSWLLLLVLAVAYRPHQRSYPAQHSPTKQKVEREDAEFVVGVAAPRDDIRQEVDTERERSGEQPRQRPVRCGSRRSTTASQRLLRMYRVRHSGLGFGFVLGAFPPRRLVQSFDHGSNGAGDKRRLLVGKHKRRLVYAVVG